MIIITKELPKNFVRKYDYRYNRLYNNFLVKTVIS